MSLAPWSAGGEGLAERSIPNMQEKDTWIVSGTLASSTDGKNGCATLQAVWQDDCE